MPGAPAKACAPRGTRAPQEGRDGCAAAAADAREMVVYGRGKMGGHIKGRAGGAHAPKRERNGRPSAAVALVAPAAAVAAAAVPAAAPEAATTTLAASAALIEAARNTPPEVIDPYKCATRSKTSGVWPETTLVILSMVCSRSPGLIRSGL